MCLLNISIQPRKISSGRTNSDDERADCETSNGILQQIRRTSTQQRRRGAHASIVVSRLERFAGIVSAPMRPRISPTYYPMAAWWTLSFLRGKLTIRRGGERLLPQVCLASPFTLQRRSAAAHPHSLTRPQVDHITNTRARSLNHAPSTS